MAWCQSTPHKNAIRMCWVVSYNLHLTYRQNGEERAHTSFLCQEPTHSVRRWLTSGKRLRKEKLLASSALAHPRVLEEPDPARPESKPQCSEDVLTERGCWGLFGRKASCHGLFTRLSCSFGQETILTTCICSYMIRSSFLQNPFYQSSERKVLQRPQKSDLLC